MTVIHDSEIIGPGRSLLNWWVISSFIPTAESHGFSPFCGRDYGRDVVPLSPAVREANRRNQVVTRACPPGNMAGLPVGLHSTDEGDLVFDPMAGGGVVPDTCCAFNRRCWSFDVADRPETCPEIEHHQWDPEELVWPVKGKEKPDLIFFDPPYFKKQGNHYPEESISALARKEYMEFFRELFPLFREHAKAHAYIAFLNADWREFQGVSAREADPKQSIFLSHYIRLLEDSGWELTQILDCPLPTQRFLTNMVSRMHKNRTLGVVRRSLIIGRKK